MAELLINSPEQFMVEFLGLVQAKLRQEVMSQMEKAFQVQIAKIVEILDKIGKEKTELTEPKNDKA